MGSSLSCLCARPEGKVTGNERCCRHLGCCAPEDCEEVQHGSCKAEYLSCTHGKVLDGERTLETAVLAECSPAHWPELRAAQLDWHGSHAPQDLYAQASAEAFASSRQALQAFACLSGRATRGSEAAALNLIREPASAPLILDNSSSSEDCIAAAGLQHAMLSAQAEHLQPLTQLCHELPISQIMQGSPHLHGSQELAPGTPDMVNFRSERLKLSLEGPQEEEERCCSGEEAQRESKQQCSSRADRSQHGAESCERSQHGTESRDRLQHGMPRAVLEATTWLGESNALSSACCRPVEHLQHTQLSLLQDAKDARKVYQALSSPFSAPPPRRSISYSNVSAQGSSHNSSAAGSSTSGADQRGAVPTCSPFFSDQQGYSTGMTTPFSIWQPGLDGGAPESSSAAAGAPGPSANPAGNPFFCSEPPLRSGSEPAPLSWTGGAPRRPAGLSNVNNPRACGPMTGIASIVDLHRELHIEPLMQLVCTVLQCEVAMLTLLDSTQVLVMRNGRMESKEETETSPLPGMWPQLPITRCCETVVVSNVDSDARMPAEFSEKLGLGFFCAKPLCSAVSRRVGTLCIASKEARDFGAGPLGILNNLSELMVHEIEAACDRAAQRQQSEKLLAAMDLYQDAFMLVDTTVRKWRILHLNLMAAKEIGVPREEAKDAIFWDLFEVRNPHTGELAEPWVPCEAAAVKGQKFVLHKVRLSSAAGEDRVLTMRFRPACQEMQSNAHQCGLPLTQPGRPFYFVEVSEVPAKSASPLNALPPRAMYSRTSQMTSPCVLSPRKAGPLLDMHSGPSQSSIVTGSPLSARALPDAIPFAGLELGYVLGRGAFGSVFQGTYNGKPVAVKIIVDNDQARVKDGLPVEAHITAGLNHRNVVRTIAHAWRPLVSHMSASMSVWDSAGSNSPGPFACNEGETWLLLELCDKGTLQEAIMSGFFWKDGKPAAQSHLQAAQKHKQSRQQQEQPGESNCSAPQPDSISGPEVRMDAILAAAAEVAAGMLYLHARSIVHGDLTGANVLLQECMESPLGITAKVADFGLSREMKSTSRIETRTCGTITHMPPELLSDDVVSKAADVYAFGVLMWELYHGVRAWDGLNHAQVIHAVAILNSGLEFSPACPPAYAKLSRRCMSADADDRPTFEEVVGLLHALQTQLLPTNQGDAG